MPQLLACCGMVLQAAEGMVYMPNPVDRQQGATQSRPATLPPALTAAVCVYFNAVSLKVILYHMRRQVFPF